MLNKVQDPEPYLFFISECSAFFLTLDYQKYSILWLKVG